MKQVGKEISFNIADDVYNEIRNLTTPEIYSQTFNQIEWPIYNKIRRQAVHTIQRLLKPKRRKSEK